jgi:hypothetical protein
MFSWARTSGFFILTWSIFMTVSSAMKHGLGLLLKFRVVPEFDHVARYRPRLLFAKRLQLKTKFSWDTA